MTQKRSKISKIIKQANISRSSFYDYFNDKEDLLMHLLSMFTYKKISWFSMNAVIFIRIIIPINAFRAFNSSSIVEERKKLPEG
ncbi:TetR/AcrR family transcriptional regulator [Priestia megaterium]|uniref:TetR/AcrR family transcriptional regulator n=1 Tax=Priestia megaterium TaxID=1404 RepID=UPI0013E3C134